jgi:signal transduction histidine kinase
MGGNSWKGELEMFNKNREKINIFLQAYPIKDDNGKIISLTGIHTDITRRKKLEAAMLQSEKLSAIGQLAAGVAHEINNPLGIILGFAQSVVKRIKNAEDPLALPLKSIEREAVRCKNLVQNLLVFSRTSQNAKSEDVDLNAAVESVLSLILAQTKTHNVELVKELGAALPRINANQTQIQQIIINLCGNAVDAMPKGGTLIISTAISSKQPGYVEIRVRDTGGGIPKNLQKQIFDPFFTTKEVGKGTGLGLSLVYEIVTKHGGSIELESEEGKGAEFTVFLPAARVF